MPNHQWPRGSSSKLLLAEVPVSSWRLFCQHAKPAFQRVIKLQPRQLGLSSVASATFGALQFQRPSSTRKYKNIPIISATQQLEPYCPAAMLTNTHQVISSPPSRPLCGARLSASIQPV